MNIAVLLGGTSPERHVSMASGKGVAEALISAGHSVTLYDVARGADARINIADLHLPDQMAPSHEELAAFSNVDVITAIQSLPADTDVAFMALHGSPGEDGTVPSDRGGADRQSRFAHSRHARHHRGKRYGRLK